MSDSEAEKLLVTKGAVFQNTCSTCGASAKYRCPSCSAYSCSVDCVKSHKLKNNCSGVRDNAAFMTVEEFKDSDLMSDYQFLEGIYRNVDSANRTRKNHGCLHYLPQNLYRLKMAAHSRGTDLQILPILFAKRKRNTSYLRYSDRKIFWRLEWEFPQTEACLFDEKIDEEVLLGKCLDKYLLPGYDNPSDLTYYKSFGHEGVTVLIKKEQNVGKEIKYYKLSQKKSLKSNFKGKRIIEYPTLLVIPNIHLGCYDLVETDAVFSPDVIEVKVKSEEENI